MPHPFFSARTYPWSRADARAFHVALYQSIESQATIRLLYRQAGGDTPLQDANAVLMWKAALEHLTTARKLDQLCSLILEKPAWKAIHDVVRAVVNAEGSAEDVEQQVRKNEWSEPAAQPSPQPPLQQQERLFPYALLSLGSFAGGALLIWQLLANAQQLVALGLEGRFYYLTLLPLGLAVTGFLFGVLRSLAIYRGQHFGGAIELGGPIVGFALVVIGGFLLPAPGTTFPLTIYVHGPAGEQDLPLRNEGTVLLDLAGDRQRRPIGDDGQAFFPAIPVSFRGEKVNVTVDAPAFQRVDNSRLALDGASLYVKVQRKPARIRGYVQDGNGHPIAGATISVAGLSANSRGDGRFELVLTPDLIENSLLLRVTAEGYQPWTQNVVPDGAEITAVMQR